MVSYPDIDDSLNLFLNLSLNDALLCTMYLCYCQYITNLCIQLQQKKDSDVFMNGDIKDTKVT